MSSENRMMRINEVVRREISEYIEKYLQPDFKCLFTVTQVKVAPDLSDGIVYVSFYGKDEREQQKAFGKLKDDRNKIQAVLNKNMHIRKTPRLEFRLDDSMAHADKIYTILNQLGL